MGVVIVVLAVLLVIIALSFPWIALWIVVGGIALCVAYVAYDAIL
jgi:hypothetical protein